jgi:hypothetical protein
MGEPQRDVDELREEIEAIILRGSENFLKTQRNAQPWS